MHLSQVRILIIFECTLGIVPEMFVFQQIKTQEPNLFSNQIRLIIPYGAMAIVHFQVWQIHKRYRWPWQRSRPARLLENPNVL